MAINLQRRNAFAASFNLYPNVLEQFVTNNCALVAGMPLANGQETNHFNKTPERIHAMMKICMAQFCVRLLQTRATNATSALESFVTDAIDRYHNYQRSLIGGLAITAEPQYRQALQHVEQGMSELVFHALAEEARIIELQAETYAKAVEENEHIPSDIHPPEDFDEGSFWHDVFLALTQNQTKDHPKWFEPVQEIVLNHLVEFKSALEPS